MLRADVGSDIAILGLGTEFDTLKVEIVIVRVVVKPVVNDLGAEAVLLRADTGTDIVTLGLGVEFDESKAEMIVLDCSASVYMTLIKYYDLYIVREVGSSIECQLGTLGISYGSRERPENSENNGSKGLGRTRDRRHTLR